MIDTARRATLFALHQLTIAVGIALLPVAVLARHLGLRLPLRRLIEATGQAYRSANGV